MVRLREIERTAVFAWSPGAGAPLIVTGTRAGAVNDDFSSEVKLELWELGLEKLDGDRELSPAGSITTDSAFNDIAWSQPDDDHPLGVIAGALENGSVDVWDAQKLRSGSSDAFISRTTKHSGSVKALQWNPYRHNLLASVGAKGEIYIYDLSNMANPYRLGASTARADDIECLDWNKQEKTAHILATGSSGGFVTVWDVKQKKEIMTLNNQGRKAVSAVAWDPTESTKLATATPNDQEPLIFLWSLRNSSAPERTLKGHELGVLGLAWCLQDSDLLLSCGKDNRTICWNPKTGERYGDFATGSNWVFQTKWNPHNPNLIASASFDGKILVTSIQSTNGKAEEQGAATQGLDGEDFFAKAQTQPQGVSFNLPKAPKWAGRPSSLSFGFGGRLIRVSKNKVSIDTFEVDSSIGEATTQFEEKLRSGDLASICSAKIEAAETEEEKADWQVINTLNTGKSRKQLRQYLGFDETDSELANATEKLTVNGDAKENGSKDEDFFNSDGDSFLADLAGSKGAKINNPFKIYTGSESEADKRITRALMLGQFEAALDVCLEEDRMSDAFMIAICGGQSCIDKAQSAYLRKQAKGPNYLRLLASIVGKNLWDVVHNADINSWKEVMATLCTYADEKEFSDLCEALGDRLEEAYQNGDSPKSLRRDVSFCYLVGAKMEKVVNNWVEELQEQEKETLEKSESDNGFSVHAKCLQDFIEKVSVFRKVANFNDSELQATADWKLAPLYTLYSEYAEILSAHGQLASAERYLDLLPPKFSGAETAQQRVKQATRKAAVRQQPAAVTQRTTSRVQPPMPSFQQPAAPLQPSQPLINQARNAAPTQSPYAPAGAIGTPAAQNPYAPPTPMGNAYAPAGYQPPQAATPYGQPAYGGYQPPQQQAPLPPPPRGATSSPAVPPPSQAKNITDWNDLPTGMVKERPANSRRATPAPGQPVSSPFPNAQPNPMSPPQSAYGLQKPTPPLPPPPRAGEAPPRVTSPLTSPPQGIQRPPSTLANAYAPPVQSQPVGSTLPTPAPPPVARGASPYQPPPSTSTAAPSSRYAPAPGSHPTPGPGAMPPQRNVAPNPYQTQQQGAYAPQAAQSSYGQAPQASAPPQTGPPPRTGPSAPPRGPPRASNTPISGGPAPPVQQLPTPQTESPPSTAPAQQQSAPAQAKYPRGDRSHIPANAQPIFDLLAPEVARIRSVAPQSFKPQVDDMAKRIDILFDHLNNQDLLQPDTVQQMVQISQHVQRKEWDQAQSLFTEIQQAKLESEGTHWMVGVKRLIAIGRATKA
ncbi:Protein transport protein sec31 [Pseudocercospora fuligena]|uniref:Protein transport protein SEC31 n=1 Tax=Pseudocercospora fuligena TaxID=685502 RepID=A0A8H6RJA9_9PEZI|nr:Protein transport protein sec31 [Pseudocercospora fuligena]